MSQTADAARPRRVQRSELAVPAIREAFFAKAAQGPADAIFLDLEDAVPPERKQEARRNAIAALNEIDWGRKTMAVRVNALDTPWGFRDIVDVATACPRLDMVLLPKAGCAFDVRFVETLLAGIEQEQGYTKRFGIEVLIETAFGLAHVEEIAGASPRLEAMIFGPGDYSIDILNFDLVVGAPNPNYTVLTPAGPGGARQRHWNDHWHFALARIANACRAYGLRPIDGPYADYGDPDGYRNAAQRATALGFEGKWAIHPSQVALANEVFTPSAEQVGWARSVQHQLEAAKREGRGAIGVNNQLIDMAHVKLAQNILARAGTVEEFVNAAGTAGR